MSNVNDQRTVTDQHESISVGIVEKKRKLTIRIIILVIKIPLKKKRLENIICQNL
jgi:hypothetical protein